MADEESNDTSLNVPETRKKRGRKPSGLPLAEVRKNATANRLKRLLGEGKQRLDTFIEPETKSTLDKLKEQYKVSTQGEVIDILVKALK